ncbi:MAG: hypothetical protein QXP57_07425 [Nitrososphaerota archaeon]
MRRRILLLLLLTILTAVAIAYAASLSVTAVNELGASQPVQVNCPAQGCTISRIAWRLTSSAPYNVDAARVYWTATSTSKTYTVCVELYETDAGSPISSGCTTTPGSNTNPTNVDLNPNVDPRLVNYVRVVIVDETT